MLTQVEIEKMTLPERWDAMERLWQSIISSSAEIPSPGWHEEVLKERMELLESSDARFYTLEEVREKLKLRRK